MEKKTPREEAYEADNRFIRTMTEHGLSAEVIAGLLIKKPNTIKQKIRKMELVPKYHNTALQQTARAFHQLLSGKAPLRLPEPGEIEAMMSWADPKSSNERYR